MMNTSRWSKLIIIPLLTISFLSHCARDPQIKRVETALEPKGRVGSQVLGLDSSDQLLVQDERRLDRELYTQIMANHIAKEDLATERFHLQRCRDDLTDPRLGGSGDSGELPEAMAGLQAPTEESWGIDGRGDAKIVRRTRLDAKLKTARDQAGLLKEQANLIKTHLRKCQKRLRLARIQHGLPPERYEAKGYFGRDGTWVSTQEAEKNLDDAFRIRSKLEAKKAETQPEFF